MWIACCCKNARLNLPYVGERLSFEQWGAPTSQASALSSVLLRLSLADHSVNMSARYSERIQIYPCSRCPYAISSLPFHCTPLHLIKHISICCTVLYCFWPDKLHSSKVVPPQGWCPRSKPYPPLDEVMINVPIRQHVFGTRGAYRGMFVEQKSMNVAEFKQAAEDSSAKVRSKQRNFQVTGRCSCLRTAVS
jgi:hypothetical protein